MKEGKVFLVFIGQLVLIAAAVFAVYGNSLRNGFVYDDYGVVEGNALIRQPQNLPFLLSAAYFRFSGETTYRPLVTFSYFIDHFFWKLKPAGYHLTNVLLHAANAVLVFLLARVFLKGPGAALAGALFFAVHPAAAEAVNAVGFREDLLAAGFCLLSILLFDRALACPAKALPYGILSACSFFFAVFSKEMAVTLPLLVFLYEACKSRGTPRFSRGRALLYSGLILVLVFYLVIRFRILRNPAGPAVDAPALTTRLLTAGTAVFFYLKLFLFPLRLSAEYMYPFYSSFLRPAVFLSFAGIAAIIAAGAFSLRRAPALAFAAGWFLISLLPVAGIVALRNPVPERYLYFPLAGLCLLPAWLMERALVRLKKSAAYPVPAVLAAAVLLLFSMRTVARNRDWKDAIVFCRKTVASCPESARFRSNLGVAYQLKGRLDEAAEELRAALELDPGDAETRTSLGSVYQMTGEFDKAVEEYKTVIALHPEFTEARNGLGTIYQTRGQYAEALDEFLTAVSISPDNHRARYNLGVIYQERGRLDEAVKEYQAALELDPFYVNARNNLGIIYNSRKQYEEAMKEYQAILSVDPGYASAYNNLGLVHAARGDYAKAEECFKKALTLNPHLKNARENLILIQRQKGI